MNNKVFIIGAGAVGKALAVLLQHKGENVTLIRGSKDDLSPSLQTIRLDIKDRDSIEAGIEVSTFSHFDSLNGLIILTNKSYGNTALANILKDKAGNAPVVLLQNGLNIEQPFLDVGLPAIYRCVLFVSCQPAGENRISFKPAATSLIGAIKGDHTTAAIIAETIDTEIFRFAAEENIAVIAWKKAIVNAVFNSVCPLLETDNGIFHRDANARALAGQVMNECLRIAERKGITLTDKEVMDLLLHISRSSDGQLISTYQDIRNGRPTEIGTLNGAIAAMADEMNEASAVPMTRLLGELTKIKASLFLKET